MDDAPGAFGCLIVEAGLGEHHSAEGQGSRMVWLVSQDRLVHPQRQGGVALVRSGRIPQGAGRGHCVIGGKSKVGQRLKLLLGLQHNLAEGDVGPQALGFH